MEGAPLPVGRSAHQTALFFPYFTLKQQNAQPFPCGIYKLVIYLRQRTCYTGPVVKKETKGVIFHGKKAI
jgi:hypothetical protein